MPQLREDLAKIILQTIQSVNVKQDSHQVSRWDNETYTVHGIQSLEVTCAIPWYDVTGEQKEALRTWIHHSREKFDVGRFRGMIPVHCEVWCSPCSFKLELIARFLVDFISAPQTTEHLMDWELEQLGESLPSTIFVKTAVPPRKDVNHFDDKDMFVL